MSTHLNVRPVIGALLAALLISSAGVACGKLLNREQAILLNPVADEISATAPELFHVQLETSRGVVVVEVNRSWAPIGADRFYNLVNAGFFDGQKFFRVVDGFIAQFGLHTDPAIIQAWLNSTILDDPVVASNRRGKLAYAMTGPDTRSTQIYINLSDNVRLDNEGFAPFGRVIGGMDVVDQLFAGYGESAGGGIRGGQQGPLIAEGNEYLEREFPELDFVQYARVVWEGEGQS